MTLLATMTTGEAAVAFIAGFNTAVLLFSLVGLLRDR